VADVVRFSVLATEPRQLMPEVNGVPLVDLVATFETGRGYRPTGGYAGLVLDHFDFGDLSRYFLGLGDGQWPRPGRAWLLGCDCGEVGCWPLEVAIDVESARVGWSGFAQPHRPAWDYTGFGPFVFVRDQYDRAVSAAVATLEAES
jgi:hypothetical protein